MHITAVLDDALLNEAAELTGVHDRSALLAAGLEALVQREVARRLAVLGGSDADASTAPRRRSER